MTFTTFVSKSRESALPICCTNSAGACPLWAKIVSAAAFTRRVRCSAYIEEDANESRKYVNIERTRYIHVEFSRPTVGAVIS